MKPECELNIRDIIFIRGTDNQLNTMCDDRRTIEVQGMDTPNGTVFVSTLNVTNITSSQTVECIFDDGSTEESIGNSTVFTTGMWFYLFMQVHLVPYSRKYWWPLFWRFA